MHYGLGVDARLFQELYAGIEGSIRDIDLPGINKTDTKITDRDETLYSAYLYWTPHREWAGSVEIRYDSFDRDFKGSGPTQVETLSLPVAIRYFSSLGFLLKRLRHTYVKM